jgi:hypothetical protein
LKNIDDADKKKASTPQNVIGKKGIVAGMMQ